MSNLISETILTPRKYECDVCVCGGGVAGIAAALAAKRAGADGRKFFHSNLLLVPSVISAISIILLILIAEH